MRKSTLSLPAAILLSCLQLAVFAQNDSASLDAGILKFKRNATQSISIKGEDLEKMPFTNLSDAIGAWLFGAYSSRGTLTYVVDGNPLSDVNIYSVYDIEEIVYIQNATGLLNTTGTQQQLVLITTRRKGGGKSGVSVAAQAGPVSRDFKNSQQNGKGLHSTTNWYQQYYAGIYRDYSKFSFGVSANFQRDVMPMLKADYFHEITPDNLSRWRLNGFFSYRPNTHNELTLRVNYTPQTIDSAQSFFYGSYDSVYLNAHQHQQLLTPSLRWQTSFLHKWKNDLQVTYLTSPARQNNNSLQRGILSSLPQDDVYLSYYKAKQDIRHFYVREHLSYLAEAGGWQIEPSLNASFEHMKWLYTGNTISGTSTEIQNGSGPNYSISSSTSKGVSDQYILTPAIRFGLRDAFSLQGGALVDVSHVNQKNVKRVFPFASLSTDLLKWNNPQSASGLKIFASYASTGSFTLHDYTLPDLTTVSSFLLPQVSGFVSGYIPVYWNGSGSQSLGVQLPTSFWVWEAGAQLSVLKNRLQIGYNFERRSYTINQLTPQLIDPSGVDSFFVTHHPLLKSSSHFINIMVKIADGQKIQWESGLNMALITTRYNLPPGSIMSEPVGGVNNDHPSWTGGWVNKFLFEKVSVGIGLQYHFSANVNTYYAPANYPMAPTVNSILLQYVYAGYQLKLAKVNPLEIYIDSRNLLQNSKSDLTDRRRYVGVGGKLGF